MQSGNGINSVTIRPSGKGWTVAVYRAGHESFFGVFRKLEDAEAFADAQRRNLNLIRPSP